MRSVFAQRFDVYLPPGHPEMTYIGSFTEFGIWDMNNDNIPDVAAGNGGTDLMIFYGTWPWARLEAKKRSTGIHLAMDTATCWRQISTMMVAPTSLLPTNGARIRLQVGIWQIISTLADGNAAAGDLDGDGNVEYTSSRLKKAIR